MLAVPLLAPHTQPNSPPPPPCTCLCVMPVPDLEQRLASSQALQMGLTQQSCGDCSVHPQKKMARLIPLPNAVSRCPQLSASLLSMAGPRKWLLWVSRQHLQHWYSNTSCEGGFVTSRVEAPACCLHCTLQVLFLRGSLKKTHCHARREEEKSLGVSWWVEAGHKVAPGPPAARMPSKKPEGEGGQYPLHPHQAGF